MHIFVYYSIIGFIISKINISYIIYIYNLLTSGLNTTFHFLYSIDQTHDHAHHISMTRTCLKNILAQRMFFILIQNGGTHMDINLELYKCFYYVATTLSFSEASRQLFISQSAVSQGIKSLEKKLGHELFFRSTKKVSLTPEGEVLLQHVKPALEMLSQGEAQLLGEDGLQGQLRIGASDTICRYFLIDYLKRYHQDYPGVRIKVTNSTSIGCVELLENRQVDLIVCNFPNSRISAHTKVLTVKEFQDVFVANPNFFPVEGKILELKKLTEYPLLMLSSKSTTSEYLHQFFAAHRQNLIPEVELNSNDLLVDLARIGLGIACVPDYMLSALHGQEKNLVKIALKQPLPARQIVLAQNDVLPLPQAAERFVGYFSA